jgi:HPt (histidine-containing phosphotransfer) domain-containing protein
MDVYISKPIRVEELVSALEQCVPLGERPEEPEVGLTEPQVVQMSPVEDGEIDQVLDPEALEHLRAMVDGDTDFLSELVNTFLTDAPKLLSRMRQAVEGGKASELRIAAHSLKSNSAEFGALALFELCKELEEMGKTKKLDSAAGLSAQAQAEYERVKTALAQWVARI